MEESAIADVMLFVLLVIALAAGWWLGRHSRGSFGSGNSRQRVAPTRDYFIGLNYLLNDEPDDAIDIFTDSLEMTPANLETYLALGKLLRRRGKVDRSIAVYQDLLGKGHFKPEQLNEIRINMAHSFIAAGLLDRAEQILDDLKKEKGTIKYRALVLSVNIFQQEKDWHMGVQAVAELVKVCPPEQRQGFQRVASHFYCEMAAVELAREHVTRARELLQEAQSLDKGNPRASMLRGELESRSGNDRDALKHYLNVQKQNPAFIADIFDALVDVFRRSGKERALEKFISDCRETANNASVLIQVAGFLEQTQGRDVASNFLREKLQRNASLQLLQAFVELGQGADQDMAITLSVLKEYIEGTAQYQCQNCGFELKTLHWLCPSCSQWGTVQHMAGMLEG